MTDDGAETCVLLHGEPSGATSPGRSSHLAERGRVVATVVTNDGGDVDRFDVTVEGY